MGNIIFIFFFELGKIDMMYLAMKELIENMEVKNINPLYQQMKSFLFIMYRQSSQIKLNLSAFLIHTVLFCITFAALY